VISEEISGILRVLILRSQKTPLKPDNDLR
jgi:hypothetical protein